MENPYDAPQATEVATQPQGQESSPFPGLLTTTNETLQWLLHTGSHKALGIICVVCYGWSTTFRQMAKAPSQEQMAELFDLPVLSMIPSLLGIILVASLTGALTWFLYSLCCFLVNRMTKGKAIFKQMRAAVKWSFFPYLFIMPLYLIQAIAIYGFGIQWLTFVIILPILLGAVWGAILISKGFGIVNDYSAGRGFAVSLGGGLLFLVIVMGFVFGIASLLMPDLDF